MSRWKCGRPFDTRSRPERRGDNKNICTATRQLSPAALTMYWRGFLEEKGQKCIEMWMGSCPGIWDGSEDADECGHLPQKLIVDFELGRLGVTHNHIFWKDCEETEQNWGSKTKLMQPVCALRLLITNLPQTSYIWMGVVSFAFLEVSFSAWGAT